MNKLKLEELANSVGVIILTKYGNKIKIKCSETSNTKFITVTRLLECSRKNRSPFTNRDLKPLKKPRAKKEVTPIKKEVEIVIEEIDA